ncbi:guanine deaminase [hydrocarbon metagenome]|uniref:Guanine deaminase n=1 Tax=hydrocarbon metagenome TaxID=938273 RepID=A0A0W8E6K8_9ZZZZ
MSILIKNGTIVTMNSKREVLKADILVHHDRILEISPVIDKPVEQVIDASDMLVIPGLIQTHVHLCQALFRGCADDMELLDWLKLRIWPLEGSHDADSLYYSALLGCAECLCGGTTAIIDMGTVHHTESIFNAVEGAGIRYLGGKCMMDWGPEVPSTLIDSSSNAIDESMELCQRWNGRENRRINYALCPRFALSCTEDLLLEIQRLSAKHHIPIHTHASENVSEVKVVEHMTGMRNVAYLDSLGMCSDKLILAHCIHLDEKEMDILSASKTNIAHCPSSNLKLASGIAKIPDLLNRGASISLGADGPPCNNNLDIFQEMRLASLIQKPKFGPTSMTAQTVFELATLGGARAMGLEQEIGSLEIGKKADIAIVNLNGWHTQPLDAASAYTQLVYQAKSSDVYCTVVDGKVLMLNGQLSTIDENQLRTGVRDSFIRVTRRSGII